MESRSQGVRPLRRDEKQEPPNGRGTLIARIIPQERALTRTGAELGASIEYPPPNDAAPDGQFPSAAARAVEDAAANDDPERCDLLIAIGDEWSRSGDHANAQESLRDAALLAERIGDATRFAQAVIALPGWNLASPEPPNALARLLAERALVLEQHNPGLRAMLMARLAAEIPSSVGHAQRIAELDASALELARTAHDPRCELYVRCCRERLLRAPDYLAQRLLNAEEIFRLAVERGEYAACHLGAVAKCAALATAGQISEAHETARLADGIAAMSGLPLHAAGSLAYHAASAVMDGRFADAGEAFARCRTLADDKQILHLLDLCWPMMLAPLDEMGNLNEIESAAEQALQRHPGAPVYEALLCWIQARTGRSHDATFHLQRFAADRFAAVSKDQESLVSLAALADVCVDLGHSDSAALVYERLAPHAGLVSAIGSAAVFGSVALHLGRLAAVLARVDQAVAHLENAVATNRRIGARPWAAYASYELARALGLRAASRDRERSLELLAQVEAEASGLNMARLGSSAHHLRDRLGSGETSRREISSGANAEAVAVHPRDAAQPAGFTDQCAPADHAASELRTLPAAIDPVSAQVAGPKIAIFRREGEYWLVGYHSHTFPLKHRTGLALICSLIRHPGREICAAEVGVKADASANGTGSAEPARHGSDNSGPVLDATAKQSYRARLTQLREELEEARESNRLERASNIEEEIEFITRELARALGLAGRDRKLGSEAERARKRVSLAIKEAIRVIARHDASLGRYLARSIRTGRFCSYVPDPENPLEWQL